MGYVTPKCSNCGDVAVVQSTTNSADGDWSWCVGCAATKLEGMTYVWPVGDHADLPAWLSIRAGRCPCGKPAAHRKDRGVDRFCDGAGHGEWFRRIWARLDAACAASRDAMNEHGIYSVEYAQAEDAKERVFDDLRVCTASC